jgi:Proteasome subunit
MPALDTHKPFVPRATFRYPLTVQPVERPRSPQPVKHSRYHVSPMTVCMAGICMDERLPRFILCSDQRIETEQAGGDVCLKLDHAGDGWFALIAGNTARARDLVAVCRRSVMDRTHLMDSAEFVSEISECAHKQKRVLANDYVQSQLAMSYEYFLEHGRSRLPDRHFDEITAGVRSIDLGCDVILAGFIDRNPFLFTIDRTGSVYREESFACIGSGAAVAQASLFRRRYRGYMPIEEAAYYIYEAKKFSEVAPGVGQSTDMAVMASSPKPGFSRWQMVSPFYMARLESEYKQFGPQAYVGEAFPALLPGLSFKEAQSTPEVPMDDSQSQPASQE